MKSPVRLLFLALALAAALAVPVQVWAGGAGANGNEGDGDSGSQPPGTGSLPCEVDPTLVLKFFRALDLPNPGGLVQSPVPTIGAIVSEGRQDVVLDAWSESEGALDAWPDWRVFALEQSGGFVTTRAAVLSGDLELWQWMPAQYVGGSMTVSGTLGVTNQPLAFCATEIPILPMCASQLPLVEALVQVSGPSGSNLPDVWFQVKVIGDLVTVTYL